MAATSHSAQKERKEKENEEVHKIQPVKKATNVSRKPTKVANPQEERRKKEEEALQTIEKRVAEKTKGWKPSDIASFLNKTIELGLESRGPSKAMPQMFGAQQIVPKKSEKVDLARYDKMAADLVAKSLLRADLILKREDAEVVTGFISALFRESAKLKSVGNV